MKLFYLIGSMILGLGLFGCGSGESNQTGDELGMRQQALRIDAKGLLDTMTNKDANGQVKLPEGVGGKDIDDALADLGKKVKPNDRDNSDLDVDQGFERSLDAKQKKAMDDLKAGYKKNVKEGKVKPEKAADGSWKFKVTEKTEGQGVGREHHAVSDGRWRWSYSTNWWGWKLYLNHNFLWYLCSYTSWMLDNSGLPSWAKYALRILVCAPHTFDYGADGATIYVTWALVFWYSA